jgi:hypothetical protein
MLETSVWNRGPERYQHRRPVARARPRQARQHCAGAAACHLPSIMKLLRSGPDENPSTYAISCKPGHFPEASTVVTPVSYPAAGQELLFAPRTCGLGETTRLAERGNAVHDSSCPRTQHVSGQSRVEQAGSPPCTELAGMQASWTIPEPAAQPSPSRRTARGALLRGAGTAVLAEPAAAWQTPATRGSGGSTAERNRRDDLDVEPQANVATPTQPDAVTSFPSIVRLPRLGRNLPSSFRLPLVRFAIATLNARHPLSVNEG